MSDRTARKKWRENRKKDILTKPQRHERAVKQVSPSPKYEEYLFLLEQKNRMIQKVKLTDKDQLDRERKEKGFALYVNGANSSKALPRANPTPSPRVTAKSHLITELSSLEEKSRVEKTEPGIDIPRIDTRSRSAPEKAQRTHRKNWNTSSINIKTARGEKMHLHAPDIMTGNYSEDFEDPSLASSVQTSLAENGADEPGASINTECPSDEEDDQTISDQLLLRVDDVARLRKSLEMSQTLKESICKDLGDDSDVEEDIVDVTPSEGFLSDGDVIVLEFNPNRKSPRQDHVVRNSNESIKPKGENSRVKETDTITLTHSKPPSRETPRPLSSVRRSKQTAGSDSSDQTSSVVSAIMAENDQKRVGNPLINSYMMQTEKDMNEVEDRVLQLEPSQQRDLIKTLYKIERTIRPSSTQPSMTNRRQHQRSKSKDTELHKVLLEFLSNWGHGSLVGLTEIQLYDECNQKIEVNPSFLRLDGAKDCIGHESHLFNGRYRTVKERNMMCCRRTGVRPVTLSFRIEIPLGSIINKIKIFNYNKGLQGLNIGVRSLRISVDDDILYEGELDKGCGNQVFDYGQTIVLGSSYDESSENENELENELQTRLKPQQSKLNAAKDKSKEKNSKPARRLHHPEHSSVRKSNAGTTNSSSMWVPLSATPEPVERCQTRILVRSTDGVNPPAIDSDSEDNPKPPTTNDIAKGEPYPAKKNDKQDDLKESTTPSSTSVSRKLELPSPSSTDSQNGKSTSIVSNKPPKPQISKVSEKRASKLPWMDNFDTNRAVTQRSPSPVVPSSPSTTPKSDALDSWLKSSKPDPLSSSLDKMLNSLDKWDLRTKSQKEELKTIFDGKPLEPQPSDGMPTKVASEKEEEVYRLSASKELDQDSPADPTESASTQTNTSTAARRRRWKQPTVNLEASWTSLDMFDKSHRGRLSMDGDALEEYLKSMGSGSSGITVDCRTPAKQTSQMPSVLESISEDAMEQFLIPELPKGQNMVINIKSTWGDRYYVGLNGLEIFADTGEPISITKITADPRDINVLPDYKNDPRVVSNLIDGVNRTRDDIHMWLAPFTEGANHFICIAFAEPAAVALLRVWNYNKSRIHSYRGAKDIEISLDGKYIFKGEIARACGGTQGGTEAFGDTILFTMSEEILDAVSRHDGQYEGGNFSDEWEDDVVLDAERPSTAEKGDRTRPHTSVLTKSQKKPTLNESISTPQQAAVPVSVDGTTLVYKVSTMLLNFTETWGDPHYLGLTGFEVVAKDGEAVPIDIQQLDAQPRDLHILEGYETDDRTLDKVLDGVNITVSDEHMWLIPFTSGSSHTVIINFSRPQEIVGLRFWNYNKSAEDTYRGAKTVHVLLDGSPISPPDGFLVRKGPGNCYYDFAQELLFSDVLRTIQLDSQFDSNISNLPHIDDTDDYVLTANMPKGFVYQFHFMSTHGDLYYLGLNAIEFYDATGKKIDLDENNIAAYPDSVNVLDGVKDDIRTPDKLIVGDKDPNTSENMWLSPILPSILNRLFVIFDYPQMVSMIKIWNYAKNPNRGVRDFTILVDDLLVFNGALSASRSGGGILPNTSGPLNYQTVLFTHDQTICRKVGHTAISNEQQELDIQLTNDNNVISKKSDLTKTADQDLRPKTSLQKRPTGRRR